jgi:hypothetical protein
MSKAEEFRQYAEDAVRPSCKTEARFGGSVTSDGLNGG